MTWKVNGTNLDAGNVVVTVEQGSMEEAEVNRSQTVAILHGRSRRHVLGQDLPTVVWRFNFIGPAPDRYTRLKAIRAMFRLGESFTLEAPALPNESYVVDDSKGATLSFDSARVVHGTGLGMVGLEVSATVLLGAILDVDAGGIGGPAIGEGALGE